MTNREKEILNLIKQNPLISQNELANLLGITRSSVAVHITNLIKKGYIEGKGYIIKEDPYICILGGANIDITGFPNNKLIMKDSNPGKVSISLGGVGRNIGENLVKLGINVKLITALGDDIYGKKILDESRKIGINMNDTFVSSEHNTSTYLSILDEKGDMQIAIAHMDIFNSLTLDFAKSKKHVIDNSKLCILDTNLPKDIIEYIVMNNSKPDFFLDTVSSKKAEKVKNIIGYFHTIKPNKIEAEILSGIHINTKYDLQKSAHYFLNKGVKRVFITLGSEGIYYNDGFNEEHILSPDIKVVNATGAGDAFIAALAYCYFNDLNIDYSARFAMAASILALSHKNTINPNMSVNNIKYKMEETNLC
ncbi:pseudouridine kinase [Clostridium tepidiprofundi DSM 19306]|uniref:Pseudouridine kinase n=1 Tax=Clostridium tepidiprofundi DSM 19306 TaxID=1121338 RepID=A0A151B3L2_9CLOT|nr:PfkB family carbohydrate kinase [Clostridium tepidiprofundi]KYH34237.1 pseudouridine kinase [Clostridium tepidiprofundi DSM 19306]